MQKTVYYSKKYQAQQAVAGTDANAMPAVVSSSARRTLKLGGILLAACLVLAVLLVALVPVLAGDAAPVASQGSRAAGVPEAADAQRTHVAYPSTNQAIEALGVKVATPQVLPQGYALVACSVIDGNVLELSLANGDTTVQFRAAAGNDDLSWSDPLQYAFHASETTGRVTRSYMSDSEGRYRVAIWAARGRSYALVADAPLDADVMRQLAEGVA